MISFTKALYGYIYIRVHALCLVITKRIDLAQYG